MDMLQNVFGGDSNSGYLDCESAILPMSYHSPWCDESFIDVTMKEMTDLGFKDRPPGLRDHVEMLHAGRHVARRTKVRQTHVATLRPLFFVRPIVPSVRHVRICNGSQYKFCII